MANLFHTHEDDFRGTHTHTIAGLKVKHEHIRQSSGEDDPGIEVVRVGDDRYKEPRTPAAAAGESIKLDVHNTTVTSSSHIRRE